MARLGEDDVADDLGHPPEVTRGEGPARLLDDGVGATHELDVPAVRRGRAHPDLR